MNNHGLLELSGRPQWRTITGGSQRYVEALSAPFAHRIRLASPVHKIVAAPMPAPDRRWSCSTAIGPELFDRVVVATHSDQALRMLGDATPAQRSILARSRISRTPRRCTPTRMCCRRTHGRERAGTTRSIQPRDAPP